RELGEKYGRLGNTLGGSEYQRCICRSSSLSHASGKLNQSSSNAIKSPSICADKSCVFDSFAPLNFVKLSTSFRFISLVNTPPCNLDVLLAYIYPDIFTVV